MSTRLKTTIATILGFLILAGLAIARPWNLINNIPFVSPTTALTVNSLRGKSEVYLNGEKVGETPYSSEQLSPGDYELGIRRISDNTSFYKPMQKTIHLELGTRTFVEAEIGPDSQFSSFKLVYYRKSSATEPSLYINTVPSEATTYVDSENYGKAPVASSSIPEGRHTISVEKTGYETEETTVIAREGFTIIVELNLMIQPINLDQ